MSKAVIKRAAYTLILLLCLHQQCFARGFGTLDWQHAIIKAQKARDTGDFDSAERYQRIAFEEAKRLGVDHPFYTITLRHLSDTAYTLARLDAAKKHALAELEILKPLGPNYQDVVPVLLRLGEIAFVNGKIAEAKSYIFEAKRIRDRSVFNPLLKAEIACRLSLLALVDGDQQECNRLRKTAEEEWIRSVKEQKTGSNMGEYGYELARLTQMSNKQVRRAMKDSALYFMKRSLQITEKCQGTYGLGYINTIAHLGECYGFHHKTEASCQCFKKAMEKTLDSPILTQTEKLATLAGLAKSLTAQQQYDLAMIVLLQELRFSEEVGKTSSAHIEVLTQLAECSFHLKRYEQAIAFKRQLLDIYDSLGMSQSVSSLRTEIDILSTRIK